MSLCVALTGLMFQTIGLVLNIVGVATSNWLVWTVDENDESEANSTDSGMKEGLYRFGLFRVCSDELGDCKDFPHSLDHYHDIIEGAQAATLAGTSLGVLSLIFTGCVLVQFYKGLPRKITIAMDVLLLVLQILFTATGAVVFFLKMKDEFDHWEALDIGYSAYACFLGAIMMLVFGSIAMCGAGKNCTSSSSSSYSSSPHSPYKTNQPADNGLNSSSSSPSSPPSGHNEPTNVRDTTATESSTLPNHNQHLHHQQSINNSSSTLATRSNNGGQVAPETDHIAVNGNQYASQYGSTRYIE